MVFDWTPIAAVYKDLVHLMMMAHGIHKCKDTAFAVFVMRTPETAPFLLAHREIMRISRTRRREACRARRGPSFRAISPPYHHFGRSAARRST